MLSDALTLTGRLTETLLPSVGDEMEIDGGVESATFCTLTVIDEVETLPRKSVARAENECKSGNFPDFGQTKGHFGLKGSKDFQVVGRVGRKTGSGGHIG